jgi:hypothetical protein
VPQILHPDGSDDPRRAEEQFLDLLLSEEELLQAEFDAIIAADWSSPPSSSPARDATAEPRPPWPHASSGPAGQPRRPRAAEWVRPRSHRS